MVKNDPWTADESKLFTQKVAELGHGGVRERKKRLYRELKPTDVSIASREPLGNRDPRIGDYSGRDNRSRAEVESAWDFRLASEFRHIFDCWMGVSLQGRDDRTGRLSGSSLRRVRQSQQSGLHGFNESNH
jgi:hypothetical protein